MIEDVTELKIRQADLAGKQVFLERELQMHREENKEAINQLRQSNIRLEATVDRRISNLTEEMKSNSKTLNSSLEKLADRLKTNSDKSEKSSNRVLWIASLAAVAIIVSITTMGLNNTTSALNVATEVVREIN